MNVLLYIVRTYRGLSHSGEEGVYNVLKLLNDELALAMKLMGATTITVSTCFFCYELLTALNLQDSSWLLYCAILT